MVKPRVTPGAERVSPQCYIEGFERRVSGFPELISFRSLLAVALGFCAVAHASPGIQFAPIPPELRSSAFTVTVNGKPVDVAHAAASYEYVSFDMTRPVDIEITSVEPH